MKNLITISLLFIFSSLANADVSFLGVIIEGNNINTLNDLNKVSSTIETKDGITTYHVKNPNLAHAYKDQVVKIKEGSGGFFNEVLTINPPSSRKMNPFGLYPPPFYK